MAGRLLWPVNLANLAAWVPIGAEQTASGYEVAWKVTGADQYTVWNTDNSGNFVSSTLRLCLERAPRCNRSRPVSSKT